MSSNAQAATRKEAKDKDKEKDKEEQQRRLHVATALLDLQPAILTNVTVAAMCTKYAKMGGSADRNACKLDLLRMLAVARR